MNTTSNPVEWANRLSYTLHYNMVKVFQTSARPMQSVQFKRHFPSLSRKHHTLRRWPKRFCSSASDRFIRHSRFGKTPTLKF